jgi:ectoine hydroxylase-related dioxygenase (phytanoyl-CoA dioxygenase family)
MTTQLERDGFALVTGLVDAVDVLDFRRAVEARMSDLGPGMRGLAQKMPCVRRLSESRTVRAVVESVLGSGSKLVRSILFSKSEERNWQVAWHQDLSIAVRELQEVEGFTSWSFKDGVPHVQPPIAVLQQMLTVRIHLDPADESNGALWVVPGSHRLGRVSAGAAAAIAGKRAKHICVAGAGDALLMRPLLLHASRKITSNRPRRVIHLEFSADMLPSPLAWAEETSSDETCLTHL